MVKKIKFSKEFLLAFILCAFAIFLCFFNGTSLAVTNGLKLWVATLVPSLFPFLVVTAFLSENSALKRSFMKFTPITKRAFGTSGLTAYAFFMSALSGYPVGAKIISDLKLSGLISDSEAKKASVFCSTSSPAFTINCVGKIMFNSTLFGVILYFINIFCALVSGVVFSLFISKDNGKRSFSFSKGNFDFYDGVYQSVISLLVVGGIIAVFSVISEVLLSLNALYIPTKVLSLITSSDGISKAICVGAIECSNGLKLLAELNLNFFSLPVSAFLCGLGGICVMVQSVAFLKRAKIKTAVFYLGKIFQAVLGFILGCLFSGFFV